MSGVEVGIIAAIAANAGVIMPIIISIIAIIGSIVGFIRYLKKNVTKEVVDLRKDVGEKFNAISDKIQNNQNTINEHNQFVKDRMREIQQMMGMLDVRITEVKTDVTKRLDFKRAELQRLQKELDTLRTELTQLEIQQAHRMDAQEERMGRNDIRMDRGDVRMNRGDRDTDKNRVDSRAHRYDTGHSKSGEEGREEEDSSQAEEGNTEG